MIYRPPQDHRELVSPTCGRLFVAGDAALLDAPRRVAIIGSRKASPEGRRRAAKLAAQLARAGVVVVSGLAEGVDRAAHEGALAVGGRTIAVLGTPLQRCYPADHAQIQERLYVEHLVVSQFPAAHRTRPRDFVARNRTMAMLVHATVIVEAADGSGSLSQAAETQRIGRPLFLLPSILARSSLAWPATLLAKGAQVLGEVGDLLRASDEQRMARVRLLPEFCQAGSAQRGKGTTGRKPA